MLPSGPMAELREIVSAHQPDETGASEAALEDAQRVGGIARTQPRLDIGDLDARIVDDGCGGSDALDQRGHAAHRLQRVLRRDEPPDLVEAEAAQRLAADMQMAAVGRVERAAEQADAPSSPIAKRRGEREAGSSRRRSGQGRTWPSPR